MIYPDVSLEEWCEKWDLEVESSTCYECGRKAYSTIPYLEKDYAGLESPLCPCGSGPCVAVMVPRTAAAHAEWSGLVRGLLEVWDD